MKPDIDPTLTIAARPRRQHVPPERARAPEGAVEIDVEHVEPMLVGDVLRRGFAARDAGIVDEDVDPPGACASSSAARVTAAESVTSSGAPATSYPFAGRLCCALAMAARRGRRS